MLISEIYHKNVITIDHRTTIIEALKTFIKKRINGLIVVDGNDHVVGVLSIQDIAAATIPSQFRQNIQMAAAMYRKGFFSENCQEIKDNSVKTIMRKNFTAVNMEDNIMAVTADFLKNDLYIVPVFKEGELVGVVTRSEIKKALAYGMKLHGYF